MVNLPQRVGIITSVNALLHISKRISEERGFRFALVFTKYRRINKFIADSRLSRLVNQRGVQSRNFESLHGIHAQFSV